MVQFEQLSKPIIVEEYLFFIFIFYVRRIQVI